MQTIPWIENHERNTLKRKLEYSRIEKLFFGFELANKIKRKKVQ